MPPPAELFDPASGTFSAGSMVSARHDTPQRYCLMAEYSSRRDNVTGATVEH